ncbi:unnamed protein product [Thelazia callipaeda]|uniref:Uncharacterized protein n=1 Tax=Thelazia callipaeda TaxID=103827 RepID=A0A0N5CX93_THECL|nr:unnamed protein product [Thelazia callipaeda]
MIKSILSIHFCFPTVLALIALPGQIPYWAGSATPASLLGNNLGLSQLLSSIQLSNLGLGGLGNLLGFGASTGLSGLSGLTGLGGLSGLGGLTGLGGFSGLGSFPGLGGGGFQVIQIPIGDSGNNNSPSCIPCSYCTPTNYPTNNQPTSCINLTPQQPSTNGQICCCCTNSMPMVGALRR